MKSTLISLMILFLGFTVHANSLVGDWEGECESWGDSTMKGTYNYNFNSDGEVFTYLQYHDDDSCNSPSFVQKQAKGTYEVVVNEYGEFEIVVEFTHVDYPLYYTGSINGDRMEMCRNQRCGSYIRIGS